MRASRVLLRQWVAQSNKTVDQSLGGKPIRNMEMFEKEKLKLGSLLIREASEQLRTKDDHSSYWEALKRQSKLIKYKITAANFENKFVDLLHETGLTNDAPMLRSLKAHFESKRLDQNPVQKSAYGQLLLMLSKLEGSKYDEQIEQIYVDLKTTDILSKEVCVNFTIAYSRSSLERFRRICQDLDLMNKPYACGLRMSKRIEMLEIAFDYAAYDVYFAMLQTFEYGSNVVLQQFRSKSDRIASLPNYIYFLDVLYKSMVSLCTSDTTLVNRALKKLGDYRGTVIKTKGDHCPNCGERMPRMSDEELEKLRVYFDEYTMNHANEGRRHSSDVLMKNYIRFLECNANKLDLVIDGLNLGFQGNLGFDLSPLDREKGGIKLRTDAKYLEENLLHLMEGIVAGGDYPNILFISRFNQYQYERLNKLFAQNNIEVRYFQRHIEDDLPVILAALYNRNCRILTNDFYDDHHHEMEDPELKKLFRHFLNSRRVTVARSNNFLNYYNEGWTKQMHYNPETQGLHVPFDSENVLFKRLYTWQCYQKTGHSRRI